jgi:hypothetical protein
MERIAPLKRSLLATSLVALVLSGCSAPKALSSGDLEALGVHDGVMYWIAEQKLAQSGYSCYVSGANRENFDCTRNTGFLPTCILRIVFQSDDRNLVSNLRARDPACLGTP